MDHPGECGAEPREGGEARIPPQVWTESVTAAEPRRGEVLLPRHSQRLRDL